MKNSAYVLPPIQRPLLYFGIRLSGTSVLAALGFAAFAFYITNGEIVFGKEGSLDNILYTSFSVVLGNIFSAISIICCATYPLFRGQNNKSNFKYFVCGSAIWFFGMNDLAAMFGYFDMHYVVAIGPFVWTAFLHYLIHSRIPRKQISLFRRGYNTSCKEKQGKIIAQVRSLGHTRYHLVLIYGLRIMTFLYLIPSFYYVAVGSFYEVNFINEISIYSTIKNDGWPELFIPIHYIAQTISTALMLYTIYSAVVDLFKPDVFSRYDNVPNYIGEGSRQVQKRRY